MLMQLFSPNHNIEGVDAINAYYGGTNALFNTVNWFEYSAWDGRDAIVVAGDVAIYDTKAARPTGGARCIAILLGPDAPNVFDEGLRDTHMKHIYDFHKANLHTEYPFVDGQYSVQCYLEAMYSCCEAYNARKALLENGNRANGAGEKVNTNNSAVNGHSENHDATTHHASDTTALDSFDHLVFHSPTCKLVTKAHARMLYLDYLKDPSHPTFASVPASLRYMPYQASLKDKVIEKTFLALTKDRYKERVHPSILLPTMCGNRHCASVHGALLSLICNIPNDRLPRKRVGVYSYGGDLAANLFSVTIKGDVNKIVKAVDLHSRLDNRRQVNPEGYVEACKLREAAYGRSNRVPKGDVESPASGTYYLAEIGEMFRREYKIKE